MAIVRGRKVKNIDQLQIDHENLDESESEQFKDQHKPGQPNRCVQSFRICLSTNCNFDHSVHFVLKLEENSRKTEQAEWKETQVNLRLEFRRRSC